uniref:Cilia- and flagella-associated protein 91 n=1 Tax=Glossina brevipalpis TaxID=37001 RepID=A0A1A9WZZ7_9MUSC
MAYRKQQRKSGANIKHKNRYVEAEFESSPEMCSISTSTEASTFISYINNERQLHFSSSLSTSSEDNSSLYNNADSKRRRLGEAYSLADKSKTYQKTTKRSQIHGTQTLYRETSAQTLPYLPEISKDHHKAEDMELLKLPTVLPGDGPPGLYEVEVLERARKRWAFFKAFKLNMQRKQQAARERIQVIKHKRILEAFEWEHWIEREEYIQECQMLRLEILIRMFNDREHRKHTASNKRISMSYEKIEQRRKMALKKNEIEHDRALRALSMKRANQSRVWRKEPITYDLGNTNSEYYAPKMRYGVNPNRRHFKASRKAFDKRMGDLEKRALKMGSEQLKCQFAKLKEWSKPKQNIKEYEQNFCSDNNLKKLYESLKYLRHSFRKDKQQPQCLAAKIKPAEPIAEKNEEIHDTFAANQNMQFSTKDIVAKSKVGPKEAEEVIETEVTFEEKQQAAKHGPESDENIAKMNALKAETAFLNSEFRREECDGLIQLYEGTTIGWLMRFLGEEMQRSILQRKLHFFCMVAQKERWHREAAEAGLRQKEDCMRDTYEEIYESCDQANGEIAEKYLEEIINSDIENFSTQVAEEDVVKMAQSIDKDTDQWLQSFKEIQNPLNYDQLRCSLRENILPNKERIICETERKNVIIHIIYDILLNNIFEKTESYDICNLITDEIIDRLIDTDLYYESTESSSVDEDREAEQEVYAVIRKLVRYAVPGIRYFTPDERIFRNEVFDLLDEIFNEVDAKESECPQTQYVPSMDSHADVHMEPNERQRYYSLESEGARLSEIQTADWQAGIIEKKDYTKALKQEEELLLMDTDQLSIDKFMLELVQYKEPEQISSERLPVREIPSTHELRVREFSLAPVYAPSDEDNNNEEELQTEDKNILNEPSEGLMSLHSHSDEFETQSSVDEYKEEEETNESNKEKERRLSPSNQDEILSKESPKESNGSIRAEVAKSTITVRLSYST